jgi:tetratricopeptide (TPR) repeat protein
MNTGQPSNNSSSRKSKLYFTIATAMLFAMALSWSLDDSFIYFFLGIAVFFIFLWFDANRKDSGQRASSSSKPYQQSRPEEHVFNELKDLFTKKEAFRQQRPKAPRSPNKVIFGVFFFVFSIFFLIIMVAVFSDDEDASSDAFNYYTQAEQFRWSNDYDSAIVYYQRALLLEPDYVEALNGYGNVLLQQQQYDSARGTFNQVLEINPDDNEARYKKALTYQYQKEFGQSLQEAFKLIKNNPEFYDAMVLAGDDYYNQQHYDSALYWYEEAYGKGSRSAWLCHVMGYLQDTKGNTDKAIALYKEALSIDSTKTDVYARLGELHPGMDGEVYRKKAAALKQQGY